MRKGNTARPMESTGRCSTNVGRDRGQGSTQCQRRELTWDGYTEVLGVCDQQFPLELIQANTCRSCAHKNKQAHLA